MQSKVRIMPTTLVASILMLHRKGISEDDLERKVKWLGQDLTQRGVILVRILNSFIYSQLKDYPAQTPLK